MATFKVGDNAVYPAQGVGVIVDIVEKEVGGAKKKFYIMKISDNEMKIMVPIDRVETVGLREIITEDRLNEVYEILRQRNIKIDNTTWNRRYREYMEKIKTGSIFEIAEVLRNLVLLRGQKDLSFGERKMMDTAKNLLIKEISISKGSPETLVENELQAILEA